MVKLNVLWLQLFAFELGLGIAAVRKAMPLVEEGMVGRLLTFLLCIDLAVHRDFAA